MPHSRSQSSNNEIYPLENWEERIRTRTSDKPAQAPSAPALVVSPVKARSMNLREIGALQSRMTRARGVSGDEPTGSEHFGSAVRYVAVVRMNSRIAIHCRARMHHYGYIQQLRQSLSRYRHYWRNLREAGLRTCDPWSPRLALISQWVLSSI